MSGTPGQYCTVAGELEADIQEIEVDGRKIETVTLGPLEPTPVETITVSMKVVRINDMIFKLRAGGGDWNFEMATELATPAISQIPQPGVLPSLELVVAPSVDVAKPPSTMEVTPTKPDLPELPGENDRAALALRNFEPKSHFGALLPIPPNLNAQPILSQLPEELEVDEIRTRIIDKDLPPQKTVILPGHPSPIPLEPAIATIDVFVYRGSKYRPIAVGHWQSKANELRKHLEASQRELQALKRTYDEEKAKSFALIARMAKKVLENDTSLAHSTSSDLARSSPFYIPRVSFLSNSGKGGSPNKVLAHSQSLSVVTADGEQSKRQSDESKTAPSTPPPHTSSSHASLPADQASSNSLPTSPTSALVPHSNQTSYAAPEPHVAIPVDQVLPPFDPINGTPVAVEGHIFAPTYRLGDDLGIKLGDAFFKIVPHPEEPISPQGYRSRCICIDNIYYSVGDPQALRTDYFEIQQRTQWLNTLYPVFVQLHFACVQTNQVDTLQWLEQQNALRLELKTSQGYNLLQLAAVHDSADVFKWLQSRFSLTERVPATKYSLLHLAALSRGSDVLELLPSWNIKETRARHGETALHIAAAAGNEKAARYLLAKDKTLLFDKDDDGETPAFFAAVSDKSSFLQWLSSQSDGVLAAHNNEHQSLLQVAALSGASSVFSWLLDKVELTCDFEGATISHYAARGGNVKCLAALKERAEDFSALTYNGSSVLHYAALSPNNQALLWLLEHIPLKISDTNYNGDTLAHFAAGSPEITNLQWLLSVQPDTLQSSILQQRNNVNASLVHHSLQHGSPATFKWLVKERELSLHDVDELGWHAIHYAASGRLRPGKMIALAETDTEDYFKRKTRDGQTALHLVAKSGCLSGVESLLGRPGIDITEADIYGRTAVHYAAWSGSIEVLEAVLAHGLSLDQLTSDGTAAIHFASQSGRTEIIDWLLKCGRDIETVNQQGLRPIHFAAHSGSIDAVHFLVQKGAALSSIGGHDVNVVHCAAQSGSVNLLDWLWQEMKHFEGVALETTIGETPLHYAARAGNISCMRWLQEHLQLPTASNVTSVLHVAAQSRAIQLISWYAHQNGGLPVLHQNSSIVHVTARIGALELLKWLAKDEQMSLIECDRSSDMSALEFAAVGDFLDVVQWLVEEKHVRIRYARLKTLKLGRKVQDYFNKRGNLTLATYNPLPPVNDSTSAHDVLPLEMKSLRLSSSMVSLPHEQPEPNVPALPQLPQLPDFPSSRIPHPRSYVSSSQLLRPIEHTSVPHDSNVSSHSDPKLPEKIEDL